MKKIILILGIGILGMTLCAVPSIKRKDGTIQRNGISCRQTTYTLHLGNGKINYKITTGGMDDTLIQSQWGDFMFGIEYWRRPNNPGSWSTSNFLSVKTKDGRSLFRERAADGISVLEHDGMEMALFSIPSGNGCLTMKIAQFKNQPEWLFFHLSHSSCDLFEIGLFPIHGYNKPEQKESFALKEGEMEKLKGPPWSLMKQTSGCGIANFNRYANEEFGTLAVFDREAVAQLRIHQPGINFQLKPQQRSFSFAVSSFRDQKPSALWNVFFNQTAPQMEAFLKKINWTPVPDPDTFRKIAGEIRKNLADLRKEGGDTAEFETELKGLEKKFTEKPDFSVLEALRLLRSNLAKKQLDLL